MEKELGLNRSHHAGRTQVNHLTVHTKMMLKQQPKSVLNDTGDSGLPHDRTQLTSFLLDNKDSTKRTRRREKMSVKVQKFIERKKREEMIKRSLEQTIEAEKHHKIQQNLKNLDKFVQQHLRQRSQPSVGHKKTSIVQSIFQGAQAIGDKDKKAKKQHKKNKRTQDEPVVGLSEIFYPDFANNSNPELDLREDDAADEAAQQISPGKMASLHHSAIE